MSVSVLVYVLQSLLHDNIPHVLRIFRVKESRKLLNWQTLLNHPAMFLLPECPALHCGQDQPWTTSLNRELPSACMRNHALPLLHPLHQGNHIHFACEGKLMSLPIFLMVKNLYSSQLMVSFPSGLWLVHWRSTSSFTYLETSSAVLSTT